MKLFASRKRPAYSGDKMRISSLGSKDVTELFVKSYHIFLVYPNLGIKIAYLGPLKSEAN